MSPERQIIRDMEIRVFTKLNEICTDYVLGKITAEEAVEKMDLGEDSGHAYLNVFVTVYQREN